MQFRFKIVKKSKKSWARAGILETPHGRIETPAFVSVATQASVKSLTPEDLKNLGAEIILANTYHLYLRPGADVIKKAGGLHKFMNWPGPMVTDSGGFQVFSLGWGKVHQIGKIGWFPGYEEVRPPREVGPLKLVKITDDGVEFTSHLDGSKHIFTPEKSIKIQEDLGADIIFAFDECTSPLADYEYTKKSLKKTHNWALRCLKVKKKREQALFGIIQGGEYKDLREESTKFISSLPFDGIGIGGSLGKTQKDMFKILKWITPLLPEEKPRHLLGIGRPEDLENCVKHGMDLFDCVWPTRLARRGTLLIKNGRLNIGNSRYIKDFHAIEKKCGCYTCQNFTRAYLSHLFRAKELLYYRLATIHNLYFTLGLMQKIRKDILVGKL
ncbi:MAG: tRNA guanosine(34) transglycosylase Tgt [Candidatus Nealsonbacteria bacterium]|nr:tRNA guanosine(34) transglycosylase Tgt [Candidatus Nealsonbacteria bacterium]